MGQRHERRCCANHDWRADGNTHANTNSYSNYHTDSYSNSDSNNNACANTNSDGDTCCYPKTNTEATSDSAAAPAAVRDQEQYQRSGLCDNPPSFDFRRDTGLRWASNERHYALSAMLTEPSVTRIDNRTWRIFV